MRNCHLWPVALFVALVGIAAICGQQPAYYGTVRVMMAPCQTNVVFTNVPPHVIIQGSTNGTEWHDLSEHIFFDGRPRMSFAIPVSSNEQAAFYRLRVP